MIVRPRRGLVLLEVLLGLAVWGAAILGCAHTLAQATRALRAAERRWERFVSCRCALEATCAGIDAGAFVPTPALAWVRSETLPDGMILVSSSADPRRGEPSLTLTRLVWPGG